MAQRYEALERARKIEADATNPTAPELARGVNTPAPIVDVLNAIHQPNIGRQAAMAERARNTGTTVRIDGHNPMRHRLWLGNQRMLDNNPNNIVIIGPNGTTTLVGRNGRTK